MKIQINKCINEDVIKSYQEKVNQINQMIEDGTGEGNDYLGWLNWPNNYKEEELNTIISSAKYVRENFDILVVCGIGGSYLGPRAAIEAINGLKSDDKLEIIYLGNTFSPNYVSQILDYLDGKNFAINVISKSGTTTETSISFRLLKDLLIKNIGKEKAKKAIFATTDKEKGALKTLCDKEGYQTFVLPSNIGGRFSVLTPVGTFPLACAGIDVKKMLKGAQEAMYLYKDPNLNKNVCYQYAITRDYMYRHNKPIEMFVTYEPQFSLLSEWCKQLFGESEGKQRKGLFPASANFSTDLHSLGQYIQDGSPLLFETIINVLKPNKDINIPFDKDDLDGLNYLQGKTLEYVNQKAFEGTLKAHEENGNVPCNIIYLEKMDAEALGHLFYFFMKTCAMSAYLLDINPFNQPGVEVYKKNMFHLLGKKGY